MVSNIACCQGLLARPGQAIPNGSLRVLAGQVMNSQGPIDGTEMGQPVLCQRLQVIPPARRDGRFASSQVYA